MFAFDFSAVKSKSVIGKASIEISLSVDVIYEFVVEHFFENYTRWAPEVVEFKPINNNKVAIGSLARQTRIDQSQKIESTFEIVAMEKNKLMVFKGLSAPFLNSYAFESIESGTGTELTFSFELLEIELFMRPFEKLIRVAIEEGAQHTVNNIKNLMMSDKHRESPVDPISKTIQSN